MKLQGFQKELYKSHQEGQSGTDVHNIIKAKVDAARQELRVAQEALAAARAALPSGSRDKAVNEEAGAQVDQQQQRLPANQGMKKHPSHNQGMNKHPSHNLY